MENKNTVPFLILGLSIIIGTAIIGSYLYRIKASTDLITVTGSTQRIVDSDVVKWRPTFSRTVDVNGRTQGYADMKRDLEAVKKFLAENGVKDSEVTISPIMMNANYGSAYGKYDGAPFVAGYTLSQNLLIESNDVEGMTRVAQNSGILINQGIVFTSNPPEYYYSKLADLRVDMLADATKDAMSRAEKIAEGTGARLGGLRSASMGVFQVTSVNSIDVSDYGTYDTSSIKKQVTAIVKNSFSLR